MLCPLPNKNISVKTLDGSMFPQQTLIPKKNVKMSDNPVSTLNDMQLGKVNYTFVEKTDQNLHHIFEVILDINGYIFKGEGINKRSAKKEAANKAVNYILSTMNRSEETFCEVSTPQPSTISAYAGNSPPPQTTKNMYAGTPMAYVFPQTLKPPEKGFTNIFENAVLTLNNVKLGRINYTLIERSNSHTFEVIIDTNGYVFKGQGPSKIKARNEAACKALNYILYNYSEDTNEIFTAFPSISSVSDNTINTLPHLANQSLAETSVKSVLPQKLVSPKRNIIKNYPNPMSRLSDMKVGPINSIYIEKIPPNRCPIFEVILDIQGHIFKGEGNNKKTATYNAYYTALNFLLHDQEKNIGRTSTSTIAGSANTVNVPLPLLNKNIPIKASVPSNSSQTLLPTKNDITINFENPVSRLNDMKVGQANYTYIERTGPNNQSIFEVILDLNGNIFTGEGADKKSAKNEAANKALNFVFFTLGSTNTVNVPLPLLNKNIPIKASVPSTSSQTLLPTKNDITINFENPVSRLNDMKVGQANYTYIERTGPNNQSIFEVILGLNGNIFTGEGVDKKSAKNEAANKALNFVFFTLGSTNTVNVPLPLLNKNIPIKASVPSTSSQILLPTKNDITINFENPVSRLNDMKVGQANYTYIERTGSNNQSIFEVILDLNGNIFTGEGADKKSAKNEAANKALNFVFFTLGSTNTVNVPLPLLNKNIPIKASVPSTSSQILLPTKNDITINFENPVSRLNDMKVGQANYTYIERTGPNNQSIFEVILDLNGNIFTGEGADKKSAKNEAANKALNFVFFTLGSANTVNVPPPLLNKNFPTKATVPSTSSQTLLPTKNDITINFENPVSRLNDMKVGQANYTYIERTGPNNQSIFEVILDLNGNTFTGEGADKKSAKNEAANKALNFVLSTLGKLEKAVGVNTVHSSTSANKVNLLPSLLNKKALNLLRKYLPATKDIPKMFENPLSLLNDMQLGQINYKIIEKFDAGYPIFEVTLDTSINGYSFKGEGPSKKSAKNAAANEALNCLLLILHNSEEKVDKVIPSLPPTTSVPANKVNSLPPLLNIHQKVPKTWNVLRKYLPVTKGIPKIFENPLSLLNDMQLGQMNYKIVEKFGPGYPIFEVTLDIKGYSFKGEGPSKKSAKNAAANEALNYLLLILHNSEQKVDKAIPSLPATNSGNNVNALPLLNPRAVKLLLKSLPATEDLTTMFENPVSLLNDMQLGQIDYKIIEKFGPGHPIFEATLNINGYNFKGEGSSMKTAKNAAANEALNYLLLILNSCEETVDKVVSSLPPTTSANNIHALPSLLNQNIPQKIQRSLNLLLKSLPATKEITTTFENPVSLLNDMQLGKINYRYIQKLGLNGYPIFQVTLEINGYSFKGEGSNKGSAKNAAANKALDYLLLILNNSEETADKVMSSLPPKTTGNNVNPLSSLNKNISPNILKIKCPQLQAKENIKKSFENPVSILNDMQLGQTNYRFTEKTGPNNCPVFEVILDINGYIFKGEGLNKKSAKNEAANEALNYVILILNNSDETVDQIFSPLPSTFSVLDRTASPDGTITANTPKPSNVTKNTLSSKNSISEISENPIITLNEMQLGPTNYRFVENTDKSCSTFEVILNVIGHTFKGEGCSKKSAKASAANNALNYILHNTPSADLNKTEKKTDKKKEAIVDNITPTRSSITSGSTVNILPTPPDGKITANTFEASNVTKNILPSKNKNVKIYENPIITLNEMKLGSTNYVFVENTDKNGTTFEVILNVIGHTFKGEGCNKKSAKASAASNALDYFLHNKPRLNLNKTEEIVDMKKEVVNNVTLSGSSITSDDSSQGNTKKKKSNVRNINIDEKNPISILNELRFGLKYNFIEQSGPPHNPTFKVSVEVDGQIYYGEGNSKKAAKSEAASEALKSFIQFPSNGTIISVNRTSSNKMDFTSDQLVDKDKALKLAKSKVTKGPLMLLNELYPNAEFNCLNNESDPYARFKFTIKIHNESFTGSGSNKKLAKNAAALAALSKLINYNVNDQSQTPMEYRSASSEDQEKADTIGRLVNEKFSSLMANDLTHIKRKVLAGIVMTHGSSLTDAEVISVTTGTKCVSGEHISINGASLNDMHAEILTRRCLMNFFYDQLQLLLDPVQAEKSIFVPKPEGKGYKLKDGIEFHLYINTAPCGDARIFSPHEEHSSIDRHPNRSSRGQLRTKIESGEGTIPVKNAPSLQTWDGIIQGERLLTMSCSDKICRWNVLGLQGALLSYFIEPIYLKTIVLGSLMKEPHLYRAICGRIEGTLQGLPPPFLLNRPTMLRLTSVETRQPQKAPSFSVIWMVGMEKPEIINTNMGKPEEGTSIVAKHNLAKRFANVHQSLSKMIATDENMATYMDAKEQVQSYNAAKKSLYEAFNKAQLGSWVSKPIEQDMFDIVPPST